MVTPIAERSSNIRAALQELVNTAAHWTRPVDTLANRLITASIAEAMAEAYQDAMDIVAVEARAYRDQADLVKDDSRRAELRYLSSLLRDCVNLIRDQANEVTG